jgi:hypothetical protein
MEGLSLMSVKQFTLQLQKRCCVAANHAMALISNRAALVQSTGLGVDCGQDVVAENVKRARLLRPAA